MTGTDGTLHTSSRWQHVDHRLDHLVPPSRTPRPGVLDLSRNELVHPGLADVLARAIDGVRPSVATRYAIIGELVAGLAGHLACQPDELEIFPGSDDAIGTVLDALVGPGGHLLLQDPNYPGYRYNADLRGLAVSPWMPRPGTLRYDVNDATLAMEHVPDAVTVIADPHGTLGSGLPLVDLLSLATAADLHGHLLVVDQCYLAFGPAPTRDVLRGRDNVVRIGSFSKSHGLAGLRLGYAIGPPALIRHLRRWRRANAVSAATVEVALHLLDHCGSQLSGIRYDVSEGRDWLAGQLTQLHPEWTSLPTEANFLTVDVGDPQVASGFVDHLADRGIAVRGHPERPVFSSLVQVTAAPVPVLARVVDAARSYAPSPDTRTGVAG